MLRFIIKNCLLRWFDSVTLSDKSIIISAQRVQVVPELVADWIDIDLDAGPDGVVPAVVLELLYSGQAAPCLPCHRVWVQALHAGYATI